jgi:hypothetical protein
MHALQPNKRKRSLHGKFLLDSIHGEVSYCANHHEIYQPPQSQYLIETSANRIYYPPHRHAGLLLTGPFLLLFLIPVSALISAPGVFLVGLSVKSGRAAKTGDAELALRSVLVCLSRALGLSVLALVSPISPPSRSAPYRPLPPLLHSGFSSHFTS